MVAVLFDGEERRVKAPPHLSIYRSIPSSIYLSIQSSIYLSIYPSIYLSIHPSMYLSIHPSISLLDVHLFLYLGIWDLVVMVAVRFKGKERRGLLPPQV